jgi:hypothetical protein
VLFISEYKVLCQGREDARAAHRTRQRGGRIGTIWYNYPEDLQVFPGFTSWLYEHVRVLKAEGFLVPTEVVRLSCLPSERAYFFNAMWAYGCHYRCDDERGPSHITYDSGIACISNSSTNTVLDCGILKSIVVVQYAAPNICFMKGSWFLPVEDEQRTIKKDTMGFWTLKRNAKCNQARHNPYVFPSAVSQVRAAIQISLIFATLSQCWTSNPDLVITSSGGPAVQHQGLGACSDDRACCKVHRVLQY